MRNHTGLNKKFARWRYSEQKYVSLRATLRIFTQTYVFFDCIPHTHVYSKRQVYSKRNGSDSYATAPDCGMSHHRANRGYYTKFTYLPTYLLNETHSFSSPWNQCPRCQLDEVLLLVILRFSTKLRTAR